ncbi:MAG: hypothetical protein KKF89_05055 [Nanoarchaeota archaeon]|nr:hypothetical protein [Nanoarchaeota archaeon]MBU1855062.1 hypothetical protein [Nanoarchaeota archaeon]
MKKTIFWIEQDLMSRLRLEIESASKPVAIIGGHYPITEDGKAALEPFDSDSFGIFSTYTMGLAVELAGYGKSIGKETGLVLLVDDHSQMEDQNWYLKKDNSEIKKLVSCVDDYFRAFQVPEVYQRMMSDKGLGVEDLIKSEDGLFFQESKYRQKFHDETSLDPSCSGEYRIILEEIAKQGFGKVISFLPVRCQKPTCDAVGRYHADKSNPKMKIVQVYMISEHGIDTPKEIFDMVYGGVILMKE